MASGNSTLNEFKGSRISGYAGVRRRESLDASIGISAAGQVPSAVRAAITENALGLVALFHKIDKSGDGELQETELLDELLDMELGLKLDECVAVFRVIANDAPTITMDAWTQWIASAKVTTRADAANNFPDKPEPGSRIPGYAGLRRRASMDATVGTSSFGKVSTQLRQKLSDAGAVLKQTFADFDSDGSMTLSFGELLKGLAKYGIDLNNEEFEALFKEVDRDASGELSWEEFAQWLAPPSEYDTTASLATVATAATVGKDTSKPAVPYSAGGAAAAKPMPPANRGPPTTVGADWLINGGSLTGTAQRGW